MPRCRVRWRSSNPTQTTGVAPSCLVPGERGSHRGAEHKRTPSTPGDKCAPPLPPGGSRQRQPHAKSQLDPTPDTGLISQLLRRLWTSSMTQTLMPKVPTVLMKTSPPRSTWQPRRCQSRGSIGILRCASLTSAVIAKVLRPLEAYSRIARLMSEEMGERS